MQISPYRKTALEGCIRVGDSSRYGIDLEKDKETIFETVYEKLEDATLDFPHKETPINRGRRLFQLQEYLGVLALRATSRSLNQSYGIRPPNRNAIVRGVLESLFDAAPSHVIRCDIASFFECLKPGPIMDEIYRSTKLHPHVRTVIKNLEDSRLLNPKVAGVPRGLGLSSTFAEIRLRDIDSSIKSHPQVYRYFRFADDILIFSMSEPNSVLEYVNNLLEPEFELRRNKTKIVPLNCRTDTQDNPCNEEPAIFSYLGYKFTCQHGIKTRKSRRVTVSISDNKISERKTRIILSLKALRKEKRGNLFVDRIKVLTSNYQVRKSRHTHGQRKAKVRTGIYYNYRVCGVYEHGKHGPERKRVDPGELKSLDGFMNSLIWGANSEFRAEVDAHLSSAQKSNLKGVSFYKGFTQKITLRLKRETVSAARRAWRNA